MAKAKKKFPDLNKDGKITKADILKGRGVFKKGGKVKAKKVTSNAAYVSSKDRQAAEKMLDNKLRSEGYTGGRSDARAPSFKLTQDTKSGEYRFRKLEKGGKVPKYKKGGAVKDACYSKVKSRYSVWPSAYASGALAKCRKVGAKNWGNKSKK